MSHQTNNPGFSTLSEAARVLALPGGSKSKSVLIFLHPQYDGAVS